MHAFLSKVSMCRAIAQQTRADRHTLMFSATWPSSIQKLASEFLCNPVKVTIGSSDLSASHSVTQVTYGVSFVCYTVMQLLIVFLR